MDDLQIINLQPLGSSITRIGGGIAHPVPGAPSDDFTTGKGNYLLFMNEQKDINTTYISEGIIPNLPATKRNENGEKGARCVRFAYQMTGKNTTLKVYYQFLGDFALKEPSYSGVV